MALAEPLPEPAGPVTDPETGGTLTIDLDAVEANWRALVRQLLGVECAAVVKANAYGLGLEAVTAKLANAGCKTFFVADLAEARRARARARDATIYVLNGYSPEAASAFAELNVQPVINSTAELAEWDAFVAAHHWRGGAAIHVDTGMNRLGISADEAAALAPRVQQENHGITLLMTHLACAEIADHPLTPTKSGSFASCACCTMACRRRWPTPREYSSAKRRISIWQGLAPLSMASIPRRTAQIRCAPSSS